MPPVVVSFIAAVRQPERLDGSTHASIVMPEVRCSEPESATVTHAFVPLKERPGPYLPVVQVAFAIVPSLPASDASCAIVPVPSLNAYAATSDGGGPIVTPTPEPGVSRLPLSSTARTRIVAVPGDAGVHAY